MIQIRKIVGKRARMLNHGRRVKGKGDKEGVEGHQEKSMARRGKISHWKRWTTL